MDYDTQVKLRLYNLIAENARVPEASEVAASLDAPVEQVEVAFRNLTGKRLLVLEPGSSSRIRMAPPFSGVPTGFRVAVGEKTYYANCVWDAFGVAAALHADAVVHASDGYTQEPLEVVVKNGHPENRDYVAHFAVPAAQWWEDIVYT